jgi:hypothetical protein
MKIKAIIHPAEEGGYWAEVPARLDSQKNYRQSPYL